MDKAEKFKERKENLKKIRENFLKQFYAQSYSLYLPLAIFLVSLALQLPDKIKEFNGLDEKGNIVLYVLWESLSAWEKASLLVPLALIALIIGLWLYAKQYTKNMNKEEEIRNKKEEENRKIKNDKEINERLENIDNIVNDSQRSLDDYNLLKKQFENLFIKTNKHINEHILKPTYNDLQQQIKEVIETSYNNIKKCANEIKVRLENIHKFEMQLLAVQTSQDDMKEQLRIVKNKIEILKYIYTLINDSAKNEHKKSKEYLGVVGSYYIGDRQGDVDKLLKITYSKKDYRFIATIHDGVENCPYHIGFIKNDKKIGDSVEEKNEGKVGLVLTCTANDAVKLYNCAIDPKTPKHKIQFCVYIMPNANEVNECYIASLDEQLMNDRYSKPLSKIRITEDNFSIIVDKAKTIVGATNEELALSII